MREKRLEKVGLYCDISNDVVILCVEQELIPKADGFGYACYSVSCSKYVDEECQHYGKVTECKSLIKQAKVIAKDKILLG